jgi:enamine deaminase RidA (YjgF/YER057c/UK114 family)
MKIPDRRVATATGGSIGIGARRPGGRPGGSQGALRLVAASPAAGHRAGPVTADLPRRGMPLNEDGSTVPVGDYAGQAAKAIQNMRTALADAGASLEDVLSTRVLVASTRHEDLVAAWEVVRDSFGDHDVPSTLMGATVLGYKNQLVEIEAVAAIPET